MMAYCSAHAIGAKSEPSNAIEACFRGGPNRRSCLPVEYDRETVQLLHEREDSQLPNTNPKRPSSPWCRVSVRQVIDSRPLNRTSRGISASDAAIVLICCLV